MPSPRIEERTLYPPIIEYLKSLGFDAIGNTMVNDKEPDILFRYGTLSFVIEVKIGKPGIVGLDAVAQAYDYGRKLGTQNIIILIYPDAIKNEAITDYNIVTRIALKSSITITALTEFWIEKLSLEGALFFQRLKTIIDNNEIRIDFASTVKLIERYASDLNSVVYQIRTDELVSEVVNKLDLFTSIGEIKDKETAKKQIINLASFLLFNQLLFYHIYKRKSQDDGLPELEEIRSLKEIKGYFNKITNIDYRSIYGVNLLDHIPERKDVIEVLNDVIKAVKLLRAEHITHDLAGRFFHDLIPFEVRKVLAAFYTHPAAADLLAGLAIDKWDETVMDPACGSGTLLVSSYNRKRELYEKEFGTRSLAEMHKKFIEEDLTGIDIMPFAAHISAINLTMQNIEEKTNTVRIATQDSLELVNVVDTLAFKKGKYIIKPYSTTIQKSLVEEDNNKLLTKKGSVSSEGRGSQFSLMPVDVVIMNPPFSDREKMPSNMREKLNSNPLGNICGNQVNLWGYFLALADKLIKPAGKIAAVIPINIARGRATEKIRDFILEHYKLNYIIKPVKDFAFSEGSAFRDILLLAEKVEPRSEDNAKIVFLKKSIKSLDHNHLIKLANMIRENISSDDVEIRFVKYKEIIENRYNLMRLLTLTYGELKETLNTILSSEKLVTIRSGTFAEGFHASPKGLSQLLFITNPFSEDRIEKAFLILEKAKRDAIVTKIRNTNFSFDIPAANIEKALRTITGLKEMTISKTDFFIRKPFFGFEKIKQLSKWENQKSLDWDSINLEASRKKSHIIIAERFNPYSVNSHLLAFYSEEPLVIPHTIRYGNNFSKEDSKFEVLFLNSIVFLAQLVLNKEETTGQYLHIMDSDFRLLKYLDTEKLTKSDKDILSSLFSRISKIEFPSLMDQLSGSFEPRKELDSTILKLLGVKDSNISSILSNLYKIVLKELTYIKQP
ncbi:MAG: N-6 DNA methylase [Nitrososphaerota archaeon]